MKKHDKWFNMKKEALIWFMAIITMWAVLPL